MLNVPVIVVVVDPSKAHEAEALMLRFTLERMGFDFVPYRG